MVYLSASPDLNPDVLSLFQTTEPFLSDAPLLVFRGPASSAASAAASSSRIQCHIFTPAGFQSYSRLAISPSSPLYAAVSCLSREDQGDEVCRELAYTLYKYFAELPQDVKDTWIRNCLTAKKPAAALDLFTESHAADVASRMRHVEDARSVIADIKSALASKSLSYIDADIVLPSGSVSDVASDKHSTEWEDDTARARYGKYADLVELLGTPAFLPTSKLRRAPSRPTALNRSISFTRTQKEALRREMCELVDTEESYVGKLQDLLHNLGSGLRAAARRNLNTNLDSDESLLASLFPRSLDEILTINSAFLVAIRDVFDTTEPAAINELDQRGQFDKPVTLGTKDAIGTTDVAKCLVEHLPKFKTAYSAYLQAHERMGPNLKLLLQRQDSEVAAKIQEIGEKRLMSFLIEPVQRLPRYSLYIENMTKQLPIKHPALKSLLKAKDLVADVCAQDTSAISQSKSLIRLNQIVKGWPANFHPKARLITAIDLIELQAPYNPDNQPHDSATFIGLLFADAFFLLQKPLDSDVTARSLLSGMETLPSTGSADSLPDEPVVAFIDWAPLDMLRMTEMKEGQLLQVLPNNSRSQKHPRRGILTNQAHVFLPFGTYEGRAGRFTKDFVKARVEGRFSEREREGTKWQARELEKRDDRLGIFSAIFEDEKSSKATARGPPAQTRLLVDPEKHKSKCQPEEDGTDVVASLTVAGNGFYRLEVESTYSSRTKDFVTGGELVSVLTKRFFTIAQMRSSIRNPLLTKCLLQHYDIVLRSLRFTSERLGRSPSRTKSLRQHSPVKAIASLFGGTSKSQHESTSTTQMFSSSTRINFGPKSASEPVMDGQNPSPSKSTATVVANGVGTSTVHTTEYLENTLETFILALRARKGNIIGRVIANRSLAPEVAVNQLFNALLERPEDHEQAAQASVDVLFAAFEKFLKTAWSDSLGPVLDNSSLDEMQNKSSALSPIDFEEYLQKKIDDMVPQNRRVMRGIVGLLVDLLDGTTNDGDRGSLMATITEIVVCEGDAHDYMPLFDRLVEEHDIILNDALHSSSSQYGSTAARSSHAASGSLSSKASSWGKRLGFGSLGRKNSKADTSVNSRTTAHSARGILERTKSVDWSKSGSPLSRPSSRDRPKVVETTPNNSRPGTGRSWDQVEPLESLRESGAFQGSSVPRKKRRSSLSDLDTLPKVNTSPFWNSPAARRPEQSPLANRLGASPLRQETPSILSRPRPRLGINASPPPSTQVSSAQSPFLGRAANTGVATITPSTSPARSNAVRHRSPTRKENVPPNVTSNELSPPASNTLNRAQTSPTRHQRSPSSIPSSRGPLTERPSSGNTPPPPLRPHASRHHSDKDASPSKLRTPSPLPTKKPPSRPRAQTTQPTSTHLNDRIQDHHSAIQQAETGLMAELAKIGAEMAAAPASPARTSSRRQETGTGTTPRKENFEGRLKALEAKVPHLFRNLAERTRGLEEEVAGTLRERERRIEELEGAGGR